MINESDYIIRGTLITAAEVDMSTFLEPGEIDITSIPIEMINIDITEEFEKQHRVNIYSRFPITICIKNFKKVTLCAKSQQFNTREDIAQFIKDKKISIVYQILYNSIHKTHLLRYFDIHLNWLDALLTKTFKHRVLRKPCR